MPAHTFKQPLRNPLMQQQWGPPQQWMGDGGGSPFRGLSHLIIKQEFQWQEAMGVEARNKYRVGANNGAGYIREDIGDIGHVVEQSECVERVCCGPNRTLTFFLNEGPLHGGMARNLLSMHKPFHCQGCCVMRPELAVSDGYGRQIGHIDDPCRLCEIDQQIYVRGQLALTTGPENCCAAGLLCPACADVNIPIKRQGYQVASVGRPQLDVGECCVKNTNRMQVDFGNVTNPDEQAMVFAAAMLLEMEYFEGGGGGGATCVCIGITCCFLCLPGLIISSV